MNESGKSSLQGEVIGFEIEILAEENILEDKAMSKKNIIMDSQSKRNIDRNGFMHVELCNITKESVDPYFGREIPRHKEFGLDPETIYYGWRKGEELKKAAKTFCGLPLMREHHFDCSEAPQREHRVGSIGTDCTWKEPYITASLTITDAEAIRKIVSGERMELSSGYFFTPVFEKGEWNGQSYDFIMTDIQGNHVALVEEGRAGSDVCVADSLENIKPVFSTDNNNPKEDVMSENELEKKESTQVADNEPVPACDSDNAEKTAEQSPEQAVKDDEIDIENVLQAEGISPSDEMKKVFLAGMKYAAKNQEQSAPVKDEEIKQPEQKEQSEQEKPVVMDANTIKKQLREDMRAIQIAVRDVRPLVGELDAVIFDSADGVYLKACEIMGVPASKGTARDVCRALAMTGGKNAGAMIATDNALQGFKSRFE